MWAQNWAVSFFLEVSIPEDFIVKQNMAGICKAMILHAMGLRPRNEYIDPCMLIRHEIKFIFRSRFLTRALYFAECLPTGARRGLVC